MICPHCQKEIEDALLARYLASKGGKKGTRTLTPEQQAMMLEARNRKKERAVALDSPVIYP